jgi:hypothetical protein
MTMPDSRTSVYSALVEPMELNAEGCIMGDLVSHLHVCPSCQPVYSLALCEFVVSIKEKFLNSVDFKLSEMKFAKESGICSINKKSSLVVNMRNKIFFSKFAQNLSLFYNL